MLLIIYFINIFFNSGAPCELSSRISNGMIVELYQYRAKHGTPWPTVAEVWWPALFSTERPPPGTIQSNWKSLSLKRQELRKEALSDFLSQPYVEPSTGKRKCTANAEAEESFDVITAETMQSFKDCLESLSEILLEETSSHNDTKKQLKNTQKEADIEMRELTKALKQANDLNDELRKECSSLKQKNLQRKLERRDNQLEKSLEQNERLTNKIEQLENTVKILQKKKKGITDSRRRYKIEAGKMKCSKDEIQRQLNELEMVNEDLKCQLDDIMNEREIYSFENGKYTSDIRLTCYELLSRGVSSRNVSDIIRIVLQDVGKMKVGRLPKPTLIRYFAVEQAMLKPKYSFGTELKMWIIRDTFHDMCFYVHFEAITSFFVNWLFFKI